MKRMGGIISTRRGFGRQEPGSGRQGCGVDDMRTAMPGTLQPLTVLMLEETEQ